MIGRFAPTPSGRMHMGNVYAMLAAWLSARSAGGSGGGGQGQVLLRIEDIDPPRVVPDADKWIMDDLTWLGLSWDGQPIYQSQRQDLYQEALRVLNSEFTDRLSVGGMPLLYPCFCSRSDIRSSAAPQEGDQYVIYPGTCCNLLKTDPAAVSKRLAAARQHSLRIMVPPQGCQQSHVAFDDRVFGVQSFDLAADLGDSVVQRADGIISYQLAVVVDDLLMGVDDIVRGRDLLRSTALQIWIRRCLLRGGFTSRKSPNKSRHFNTDSQSRQLATASAVNPCYAHLPLLDDASGIRLAKRERSLDLGTLRSAGVQAEDILGYCAWLLGITGGSHYLPMTAQEILAEFDWPSLRVNLSDRKLPGNLKNVLSPDDFFSCRHRPR